MFPCLSIPLKGWHKSKIKNYNRKKLIINIHLKKLFGCRFARLEIGGEAALKQKQYRKQTGDELFHTNCTHTSSLQPRQKENCM